MSFANGYVSCKKCDFKGLVQYRPIDVVYHLDGLEVVSSRDIGWCHHCKNIRDIESHSETQQLRSRLTELETSSSSTVQSLIKAWGKVIGKGKSSIEKEIEKISGQLRLAETRGNRARCLDCGGAQTQSLVSDVEGVFKDFTHDCGGTLFLEPKDPTSPRFAYRHETIHLDQDGRRITEEG